MALDPVAVALKFGFLAVLYLFLLWMARSALRDLRRGAARPTRADADYGRHRHAPRVAPLGGRRRAELRVDTAAGLRPAPRTISPTARCWGGAIRRTSGWRTPSLLAARTAGPARRCHGVGGSRLDERHVPKRGAPARAPAAARRRPHPHRRLRVHVRAMTMLRIADHSTPPTWAAAPGQRGQLLRPRARVRRGRRHGRRPGGRGRVRDGRRVVRRAACPTALARRGAGRDHPGRQPAHPRPLAHRRAARRAWARRSPPPTSARTRSRSPTSATRAATCAATAS